MPIDPSIPLGASIGPQVDPYRAFDYALRMRQAKRLEEQDAQEAQYRQQLMSERQQAMAQQTQEREDKLKATQEYDQTMQRIFSSGKKTSDAVIEELYSSGQGHLVPLIEPHLKAFDEHVAKVREGKKALNDALGEMAVTVKKLGDTPGAFRAAADIFKQQELLTDEDLAPYLQRADADPTSIAQMTTILAGHRLQPKAAESGDFTLAPGAIRFSPTGEKIAEGAPPTTGAGATGFTLSPGEVRYDAQGNLVAKGPPKPAGEGTKARPVTSGDAGKLAQINSSLMQLDSLRKRLSGTHTTGTAAAIGAAAPKFVTDITGFGVEAKEKQAGIDLVKQIIGKALEGGVLRKEDEAKYAKILPTIGDTPAVVSSKLDGLEAEIKSHKANTLDALSDAGYDVSKYAARAEPGGGGGGGQPKATHRYNPATEKVEAIK